MGARLYAKLFMWRWCCPGGHRLWCRLDWALLCKVKYVCDKHDHQLLNPNVAIKEV